ncbi:TolC family protein [Kiritimatiellota bacterium B12222]|nr:TolC family protein [Kiritimatiellota bacterium B12222]
MSSLHAQETLEVYSLEDCHRFAVQYSPALARQRLTYSNLVEAVEVVKAIYDPSLQISQAWQDEDDPQRTTAVLRQQLPADLDVALTARREVLDNEDYTSYALSLSKTLLGGGTFLEAKLPLERAWIEKAKQANILSLEQRQLRLGVTNDFYAVVRNQLTLHLRELQVERSKKNLEHAMIKEDPLDIATAKLQIPENELAVISSKRQIANSRLFLTERVGLPVAEPLNVNTQLVFEIRPFNMEQDLASALENHEEILNARMDVELNHMEAKVARTRRYPEVRAALSMEENDAPASSDSNMRAEIVLELPWLDRSDRAEARRRENDLKQSELTLYSVKQRVEQQIKSIAVQVVEAERSVVLSAERLLVLEQQFTLYQDRWDNGEIGILEFVRSQNDLENARVQLVTKQTEYLELRAEYDFKIGK